MSVRWASMDTLFFSFLSFSRGICPNKNSKSAWRVIKTCLAQLISKAVKVVVITCSAFFLCPHVNTSHTQKTRTRCSTKKGFSLSDCSVSTCLFWWFLSPFPRFLSLCLLRHWAMWFFSQWNLILLLYAQECFSPEWVAGCVHISLPVPEKPLFEAPLFAHSLFMNER